MKKLTSILLSVTLCALLAACTVTGAQASNGGVIPDDLSARLKSAVKIELSDGDIKISDESAAYTANDVVYAEEGKGASYGAGSAEDEHSAEEAAAHTVVHITKAGDYVISGKLSKGQIAVDLGENAATDESAKVTLILDNADITCTVAPAIIFYNVYECGDKNDAKYTVDTSDAGANVVLKDGSVNTLNGSYVAKIYKSATVKEDGTVENAKKLHKYDGALYSKMSMNVYGTTGVLNVNAENEGIDSELHLTFYGGVINIVSGDDGVNTNEDNVSVTTVNGGDLTITVKGKEGDGIDSNGWLVINGGVVRAYACGASGDSGIDSDLGIYINGGRVFATGNMLDRIAGGEQTYAVFTFGQTQTGGAEFTLKTEDGKEVATVKTVNDFRNILVSAPELLDGNYTVWQGDKQLSVSEGGGFGGRGFGGGFNGQGFGSGGGFKNRPDGKGQTPDGQTPENMPTPPDGANPGDAPQLPEGFTPGDAPDAPDGQGGKGFGGKGFPGGQGKEFRGERPDGQNKGERRENTDGVSEPTFKAPDGENGAKGERPERPERPEKGDKASADKTEKGERPERTGENTGKSGKGGRSRESKTVFEIKAGGNTFYIA
ncbi:MAG: carbohydrate-binding domain-containing protein [Clostridia bacterium]|nr:carbohydrate-binding domain-containing protein [Clostridia bacterium]